MKSEKQFLIHLIKSCETFNLTEKELVGIITKVLDKEISIRTFYNYKKKLYDKEIFHSLKNSIYDTPSVRCLLLDFEETNREKSLESDKLIAEQLPERKDIFHDIARYRVEMEKNNEKTKMIITKFENQMNEPLQRYRSLPKKVLVSEKSLLVVEKKTVNVLTGHTIMPIGKIR